MTVSSSHNVQAVYTDESCEKSWLKTSVKQL